MIDIVTVAGICFNLRIMKKKVYFKRMDFPDFGKGRQERMRKKQYNKER